MPADDLEDVPGQKRRKAQGGLVEHEKLGAAHERPADGEHLLLAAAEIARLLMRPLLEDGEMAVDVFDLFLDPLPVPPGIGAHQDVLQDRELRKDLPPLGHVADPHPDDLVRILTVDPLAHKLDRSFFRLLLLEVIEQPHDRLERRRFPGPVGTQKGHDVARP